MASEDDEELARKQRLALVKQLRLRDLRLREFYNRTHTPTGVFRRLQLEDKDGQEKRKKTHVNPRSLENLRRRRGRS